MSVLVGVKINSLPPGRIVHVTGLPGAIQYLVRLFVLMILYFYIYYLKVPITAV